jgi:hypothetical protein
MEDGEHVVVLLRKVKKNETMTALRNRMSKCPICGRKAFLDHDVVDGFDFGYSAGCPSFCLDDGIHGISEMQDPRSPRVYGYSPKNTFDKWEEYCKDMEEYKYG